MASDFGFRPVESGEFYFISYNTEDAQRIGPIVRTMHNNGVPLWYDYGLEYGEEWEKQIAIHLDECKAVLMFVTQRLFYKERSYVRVEYDIAEVYGKKVIPVFLDSVDPASLPKQNVAFCVKLNLLHVLKCENESFLSVAVKAAKALGFKKTTGTDSTKKQESRLFKITIDEDGNLKSNVPAAVGKSPARSGSSDPDVERILKKMREDPVTDVRKEISRVMGEKKPVQRKTAPAVIPGMAAKPDQPGTFTFDFTVAEGKATLKRMMRLSFGPIPYIRIDEHEGSAKVTAIGKNAFENNADLCGIIIPDSVTYIGTSAFENCTSLKEIKLPKNLTFIGESAFKGCKSIGSITIPRGVNFIGAKAFQNTGAIVYAPYKPSHYKYTPDENVVWRISLF